jgi:hypothetical protein
MWSRKLLSPERQPCAVEHARDEYRTREGHTCRLLGRWRGTHAQRHHSPAAFLRLSFAKILSACDFNSIERCHPQANRDSTIG